MSQNNTLQLTIDNFTREVLESDQPVLVDFYADWCHPCKAIAPEIDKMANEFAGRARVGKVDVDEHAELGEKYDVTSIPTILVFRDGEIVNRIVGLVQGQELRQALNAAA